MIRLSYPTIASNELANARKVLESGALAQGRYVEEFELRFANIVGSKHCIAVSNGTVALYLSLLANGIGKGDIVITSPFTFIATINAIKWCEAIPIGVDIDLQSFAINPSLIRTGNVKAIIPVHLYGHMANMPEIMRIANDNGIVVIEDACQALGAYCNNVHAGTFGKCGVFSFYATKIITTGGEGGAIVTDDDELADKLRLLRNHGMRKRYEYESLGFNFRMTEIQAAIGLAQLDRMSRMLFRRNEIARTYTNKIRKIGIDGLVLPSVKENYMHGWNNYTILVNSRNRIADKLREKEIETGIFYPRVVLEGNFNNAQYAAMHVLSLPMHPQLTDDDIRTVIGELQ